MPFDDNTPLVVEQTDANCWRVREPLVYRGKKDVITVMPGFETDFATVPFFLTWLVPRYGTYTTAAVLHDWLLERTPMKRCDCDGIFRRALRELRVPFLRRWVMWGAVRLGSMMKEPTLCGVREGAAFTVLLIAGLAFVIGPAAIVLCFLVIFWILEALAWIGLRLWPRDRTKAVIPPKFPWPRKGDCHAAGEVDPPAMGSGPEASSR